MHKTMVAVWDVFVCQFSHIVPQVKGFFKKHGYTIPMMIASHLLLQIVLVAALRALLLECQDFPNDYWPFFFLVLLFCILVRHL